MNNLVKLQTLMHYGENKMDGITLSTTSKKLDRLYKKLIEVAHYIIHVKNIFK